MSSKKLVSLEKIWKIDPIEGVDDAELAYVLGWHCVIIKGQFNVGDSCVLFRDGTFIPEKSCDFNFCGKQRSATHHYEMGNGYRIKTREYFKSVIASCAVVKITNFDFILDDTPAGTDLTDMFDVKEWYSYEREVFYGNVYGYAHDDIVVPEEPKIQEYGVDLLEEMRGKRYYIASKVPGHTIVCHIDEHSKFRIADKDMEYKCGGSSEMMKIVRQNKIETKLRAYTVRYSYDTVTVVGELCALNIERNRMNVMVPTWFVSGVYCNRRRINFSETKRVANWINCETIPIEETGDSFIDKYPDMRAVEERARGEYSHGYLKKGIIIRSDEWQYSEVIDGDMSVECLNYDYLKKYDL